MEHHSASALDPKEKRMTCDTCGATLKDDARFCGSCGTPVAVTIATDAVGPKNASAPRKPAPASRRAPLAAASAPGDAAPAADSVADEAPATSAPPLVPPWTRQRKLIVSGIAAGAVLLVAAAAVGIGLAVSGAATAGQIDASQSDSGETDPGEEGDIDADPDESDSAGLEPTTPPASGVSDDGYTFRSKSGNIRCHVTTQIVICHQGEIKYTVPSQDCPSGPSGVTIGLTQDGATWPCLSGDIIGGDVLAYDSPIEKRGYRCEITFATGVTCTNEVGQGFNMEYETGVRTF
jgi:hypothetical protein